VDRRREEEARRDWEAKLHDVPLYDAYSSVAPLWLSDMGFAKSSRQFSHPSAIPVIFTDAAKG
jgi:hypothetical protein